MFENIRKNVNEKINPIFENRKLQIILTIIVLVVIVFFTANARTGNLNNLKDQTTGKWIPMDLDSYYFLRIAETMEANGGTLPAVDVMRYYTLNLGWSQEFLPRLLYGMYIMSKPFISDISMAYVDLWYPLIMFVCTLILFFFLVYVLTKSKLLSLLGVLLLSVIPPYVYHTMLGSTDHDSLGIFSFLLAIFAFVIAIQYLNREDKKSYWRLAGYILLFSATLSFAIACWNGGAIYLFMIIPMTYFTIWALQSKEIIRQKIRDYSLFYLIGLPLTFIILELWGPFSMFTEAKRYLLESQGLFAPLTYGLILIDIGLMFFFRKFNNNEKIVKHKNKRFFISLVIILLIGFFFFQFGLHKNIIDVAEGVMAHMLNPFGSARIALTVSENQQPYFSNWLTSFGKVAFWIAYLGIFFLGLRMSQGISRDETKKKKELEDRITFVVSWVIMTGAILFTRYSSTGIFNGVNMVSVVIFFAAFALFIGTCIGLFISAKINIKNELILISVWIIIMLISGRGATRLFTYISPLFVLVSVLLLKELWGYTKTAKEEITKILLWIGLIFLIGLILVNSWTYYQNVIAQTNSMGPAVNYQWQNAMSWVRTNTPEDAKFISWWDYGYHIQYFGRRASLTDGGHGAGYYDWLTGRYILAGIRPDLALSFMKTNDVDYLLIDPTDIGKYTAFSTIGSDTTGKDRQSWIPIMVQNPQWTIEASSTITFILQGGTILDQDINYEENGSQYLLPAEKAGIGGIKITVNTENGSIQQPLGIFVYNNQQKELPLRYLYLDGKIYDFEEGYPGIVRLVPSVTSSSTGGLQIDKFGAAIYISPKVAPTLFANLYLMDDPFKLYPTINIAHTEEEIVVSSIRTQGGAIDSFVYYQGLRTPLQIYKVDYPDYILTNDIFIPGPGKNEEIMLANQSMIDALDNLVVTND